MCRAAVTVRGDDLQKLTQGLSHSRILEKLQLFISACKRALGLTFESEFKEDRVTWFGMCTRWAFRKP